MGKDFFFLSLNTYLNRGDTIIMKVVFPSKVYPLHSGSAISPNLWETQLHNLWSWRTEKKTFLFNLKFICLDIEHYHHHRAVFNNTALSAAQWKSGWNCWYLWQLLQRFFILGHYFHNVLRLHWPRGEKPSVVVTVSSKEIGSWTTVPFCHFPSSLEPSKPFYCDIFP